jgi:hypothetical protein
LEQRRVHAFDEKTLDQMNRVFRVQHSSFILVFHRRPVNSDVRPPREGCMKTELQRLEDQLERALEGEAWHGPSVLEILEGVSAHQAAAHPIAGPHSIWELLPLLRPV